MRAHVIRRGTDKIRSFLSHQITKDLRKCRRSSALMKWTEKSQGVFSHTSHGAQVTLSRLSSCRAPILQEKGPCDSLRQTPGENTGVMVYWNNHNNGKIPFQNHESWVEMDKIVLFQQRGYKCNHGLAVT